LETPDADGDLSKITKWSQGFFSASSDRGDTDDNVREADSAGGALRNTNDDAVVQQDHATADDTSTRDAQSFLDMSKIKAPETLDAREKKDEKKKRPKVIVVFDRSRRVNGVFK